MKCAGAQHLHSGLHCLQDFVQAVRLVSGQAQHLLCLAQLLRQRILLRQRVPGPAATALALYCMPRSALQMR